MGKWPIDTSAPARKERPHRPWHAGHAAPNPECAHRRFGNESAEANTLKGNPGAASNVFINALKAY